MKVPAMFLLSALIWTGTACGKSNGSQDADSSENLTEKEIVADDTLKADSLRVMEFPADSLPRAALNERYETLTDEDFRIVAEELGVEVAAIKAVVIVEAGREMKGFYAPGIPVANFDPVVYRQVAGNAPDRSGVSGEKVPEGLSGYALKEYTQLINARKTNAQGALMGTFWGMFQIGGFNYKMCGFDNVNDFVKANAESEFSQLEIFAKLMTASGLLQDLKNKNWTSFARKYNGPNYAKRGYHTKMAAAYARFKNK